MTENGLFYILFSSQVFFFSHFFPKKMVGRMEYVLKNYPEEEYPKMYPKSVDSYKKNVWTYDLSNKFILILGIILFCAVAYWDANSDGDLSEALPWVFFMIQFIPQMVMEISGFSYLKRMRELDKRTVRKAELNSRRVFDYVSPLLVTTAVITFLGSMAYMIYANREIHQFTFDIEDGTVITVFTMILTHVFFAAVGYTHLRGKKLDPHQNPKDREKMIKGTLTSMFSVSIGISIFLVANNLMNNSEYEYLQPSLMSLYLQGIAFASMMAITKSLDVEDIDFEVYRKDS